MLGPIPPDDMVARIGFSVQAFPTPELRAEMFDSVGRSAYDDIAASLPDDWTWAGRRVLDFGCGSGRVLRHLTQHDDAEFVACDIHAETIDWVAAAYPNSRVYVNDENPPLPEPHGSFDLIVCGSVFSHLPHWAPWLLELRRLLKPGGLLATSIHGRGFWDLGVAGSRGEPWDEDRTAIIVEHYGSTFDDSFGPAVYVSEWWLREHWGRALEIVRFDPSGFAMPSDNRAVGQAWVVARKTSDVPLTVAALTEPSADPRELPAAIRAQWLAYQENGDNLARLRDLSRAAQPASA